MERYIRTFKTITADLLKLADWLSNLQVSQVAMESTGIYWRPVFNVLEDDERTLVLVNPQHITRGSWQEDRPQDAEWIADLLPHGLLHASSASSVLDVPSGPTVRCPGRYLLG